jgi:ketosteroid isomerase-like protein
MTTEQLLTTEHVAKDLVALCKRGEFRTAIDSLYAPDIVSIEAHDAPGMQREMRGLAAVRGKADWWEANHTVHSMTTSEPFLALEKFAVIFELEATYKPTGKRFKMREVGVYTVKNGKIAHEEFLSEAE